MLRLGNKITFAEKTLKKEHHNQMKIITTDFFAWTNEVLDARSGKETL